MTAVLDISDAHAAIVRDVLRRLLPAGVRAFVFGSRAHGGARRYSDLDLALESDHPVGLRLIGEIAEALSESDLPYKVDVIDLTAIDPAFRVRIADGLVAFPLDAAALPWSASGAADAMGVRRQAYDSTRLSGGTRCKRS